MKTFAFAFLVATLTSGCAVEINSDSTDQNKTTLTNGMTPEQAYEQFHFSVKGTCRKNDWITFMPVSTEAIPIGDASEKTSGTLVLYIQKDGTYTGRYSETKEGKCTTENGATWCPLETIYENEKLNGRWSLDGNDLVLHGIGRSTYVGTFNEKHVMALTIDKDFVSAKVVGKRTRVSKIGTNVGVNGESINQYCARQR